MEKQGRCHKSEHGVFPKEDDREVNGELYRISKNRKRASLTLQRDEENSKIMEIAIVEVTLGIRLHRVVDLCKIYGNDVIIVILVKFDREQNRLKCVQFQ